MSLIFLRNGTIYRNIFCFTKQPKAFPHKKKELSFYVNPNSHLEYLNLDNNTWKHPCTGEEFSYSFFDLYDMALVKTVKIINEVDKMLNDKKIDNKRIEKLFGNLDYGTGMDCDLEMKYKYFKY